MKVCHVLCERSANYIKWPQGAEMRRVRAEFQKIGEFDNAIGFVMQIYVSSISLLGCAEAFMILACGT